MRTRYDRIEIRARRREIAAAQRIVAAELDDHDHRPMLLEKAGEPGASARRGIARNRRIDDSIVISIRLELRGQQIDPALSGGEAITGRDGIADDQEHGRFGRA